MGFELNETPLNYVVNSKGFLNSSLMLKQSSRNYQNKCLVRSSFGATYYRSGLLAFQTKFRIKFLSLNPKNFELETKSYPPLRTGLELNFKFMTERSRKNQF